MLALAMVASCSRVRNVNFADHNTVENKLLQALFP